MPIETVCQIFYRSVDEFHKAEHLKYKASGRWVSVSSDEFRRAVEEVSMGLRSLGIQPGDRVAILSENRPEWAYADLGTLCAGAADVPIYPTLTAQQVAYALRDSGARVVFVSNATHAQKVAEERSQLPAVERVVCFDEKPVDGTTTMDALRAAGRAELETEPDAVRRRAEEVDPQDMATVIYTSGTTGDPKGVMLTHENLTFDVVASQKAIPILGVDDVALSFLPLCHSFERTAGYNFMLHSGATIAFAENVGRVSENMLEIRPTVMCSVPRLYEKMHARILERVEAGPPLRQRIFRWAVDVGRQSFGHFVARTTPGPWLKLKVALANRLVFSTIKERTGGRMRLFISGGAPLAREIGEFFGAAGLLVCEGYGLTETSPVITCNRPDWVKPGTVGRPLEGAEVKIAEDGEILTRGPHVMKGYFGKPEATAEAIDSEGFFHTGDIGHLDPDGFLVITDRKKDLIVTSGGKNIAPQPIENRLKAHPLIAEAVMIGDKRNYPTALVVPDFEALKTWAARNGVDAKGPEELSSREEVARHYLSVVAELLADLAQYEKIKKVSVLPGEFTQEAGELTPTLKVKRRVVSEKYKDVIEKMYGG